MSLGTLAIVVVGLAAIIFILPKLFISRHPLETLDGVLGELKKNLVICDFEDCPGSVQLINNQISLLFAEENDDGGLSTTLDIITGRDRGHFDSETLTLSFTNGWLAAWERNHTSVPIGMVRQNEQVPLKCQEILKIVREKVAKYRATQPAEDPKPAA